MSTLSLNKELRPETPPLFNYNKEEAKKKACCGVWSGGIEDITAKMDIVYMERNQYFEKKRNKMRKEDKRLK